MLNETHLTDEVEDNEVRVRGFDLIRCDSDSNHTGGVVVYINKKIKYRNVKRIRTEFAWIVSFQMNIGSGIITIAAVYLSASVNKARIMNFMDEWCGEVCESESILIAGDFNIDVNKDSTYSQRIVNLCADNGLIQLVNKPTRVTNMSSTIIDLCMTNIYGTKCSVSNEDQITDHKILEMQIRGRTDDKVAKQRWVKSWKNYSSERMWMAIDEWPHLNDLDSHTVDERTEWLLHNMSVSTGALITKKKQRMIDEFFDDELDRMRNVKNELYKTAQFANCASKEEKDSLWLNYKSFRTEYKKAIVEKKFANNQNRLDKVKGDMRGTWRVMNSILHRERDDIDYIEVGDRRFECDLDIANQFNEFFVQSIVKLNN